MDLVLRPVGICDSIRGVFGIRASDGTICTDRRPTDAQGRRGKPHCPGKPSDPGRSGSDNPRFAEAALWLVRTGSPWRDLPTFFGNWNTVFKRCREGVKADGFVRLFEAGGARHGIRHGRGHPRQAPPSRPGRKRGAHRQAIGRSKGGWTTKILAPSDALGNLVRVELLPGRRFDRGGRRRASTASRSAR